MSLIINTFTVYTTLGASRCIPPAPHLLAGLTLPGPIKGSLSTSTVHLELHCTVNVSPSNPASIFKHGFLKPRLLFRALETL